MNFNILDVSHILLNINIVTLLLCFFLFVSKWSKNNRAFKVITLYMCFVSIIQIIFRLTFDFSINNWVITNFFSIGQMFFMTYFFLLILKSALFIKIIKSFFIFYYLSTFIQYCFNYEILFKINEFGSFVSSLFIIIYSLFFLYENLNKKQLFYYFIIGGTLYHFGSFAVFLTANIFFAKNLYLGLIIYNLHTFLAIVFSCFVFYEYKINFSSKV